MYEKMKTVNTVHLNLKLHKMYSRLWVNLLLFEEKWNTLLLAYFVHYITIMFNLPLSCVALRISELTRTGQWTCFNFKNIIRGRSKRVWWMKFDKHKPSYKIIQNDILSNCSEYLRKLMHMLLGEYFQTKNAPK